ncbi:hypothetical protein PAPYR_9886 [Paratrimastix pyriformis]|uniref:Uncharacterized protein n=1 Tax=Paratrimastix pyriformis TaxID=342808 RepID=A0ABQ8U7B4_9EUKA|nr:hypothetical protein PAPYR_9886 [Paratrimastix pyriformis]
MIACSLHFTFLPADPSPSLWTKSACPLSFMLSSPSLLSLTLPCSRLLLASGQPSHSGVWAQVAEAGWSMMPLGPPDLRILTLCIPLGPRWAMLSITRSGGTRPNLDPALGPSKGSALSLGKQADVVLSLMPRWTLPYCWIAETPGRRDLPPRLPQSGPFLVRHGVLRGYPGPRGPDGDVVVHPCDLYVYQDLIWAEVKTLCARVAKLLMQSIKKSSEAMGPEAGGRGDLWRRRCGARTTTPPLAGPPLKRRDFFETIGIGR